MDYWITNTKKDGPDPDYRIDKFAVNGHWYSIDEMITFIEVGGNHFYVTDAWGNTVKVIIKYHPVTLRRYLTTVGDGIQANNLMRLPG